MFSKDSDKEIQPDIVTEVTERKDRVNQVIRCVNARLDNRHIDQIELDSEQAERVHSDLRYLYYGDDIEEDVKRELISAMQIFCEINEILHYREESHYDKNQIQTKNE